MEIEAYSPNTNYYDFENDTTNDSFLTSINKDLCVQKFIESHNLTFLQTAPEHESVLYNYWYSRSENRVYCVYADLSNISIVYYKSAIDLTLRKRWDLPPPTEFTYE